MSLKTEIRANTEQAQAAFKKFADALSEVEKQGKKTGQSFNDFGKTLNEIEKQGKKTGQSFDEFGKTLNEIEQHAKKSGKSFDSFSQILSALKKQSNGNFSNLINELEKLSKTSGLTKEKLNEIFVSINKQGLSANEHLSEIAKNTSTLTDKLAHSAQALNGWWDILKNTFGNAAQSFIKAADAINTMNARLKLVSTSGAHFEALRKQIDGIAKSTYSSTESISNLFIGLNSSLKSLGVSQNEVLQFSQTITQAFKVSGASAADTERALVQLNQAFSMGMLRGQEYNSVISAAPALITYMADALGIAEEKLKNMAKNGGISAEMMAIMNNYLEKLKKGDLTSFS